MSFFQDNEEPLAGVLNVKYLATNFTKAMEIAGGRFETDWESNNGFITPRPTIRKGFGGRE